ncbi:cysteine-rich receptor-like protein kinase 10 isoform X4 [Nymphaea colorata]|uniref:cysteine-rich receptor-like protein kinase 10 isoform X4 n=1 Tax=Nymphaea colorata TaxID=210225 RepID=UPI00129DC437|nr:cysteine-rich receptor-like protein kinase 10 isoform X4 [Nymphaea colorata]
MCRTECCFLFLIVLLLPLGFVDMTETHFWYCSGSSNYTANSTFSHNLQRALASVVANVSLTSFYNVTVGKSPDQAFAAAQCRGDLDGEACQVCVSDAASQVAQLCPQNRAAIIFFQGCIMYYHDANFTVPQSFMNLSLPRLEAIPDPQRFRPMLISFFNKLILSTTTNPSGRLFWGDMFRYTRNLTIYATAQCVQYLSPKGCRSCLDIAFAQMLKNFGDRQGGVVYHNIECLCVRDIPVDRCRWCLQNASSDIEGCSNGKQGGSILRGSCILAFGVQPFFFGDPTLVSLPQRNHGHNRWWIFVVICFIGGLLLAAACLLCLVRRRQHQAGSEANYDLPQERQTACLRHPRKANYDLPQVSLRSIEYATDKFSESNKLGEGGYGPVYKGRFPDGQEVAVKRLSGRSKQGLKQFRNEVELISKLQHTNLVRLIGCCLDNDEKMLIYEYMPNKSLDFFLKDPGRRVLLDWEKRLNIIIGIARGMLYLHQHSRLNIIHRDLKASNVLLDEQLNPKISDFGLARIFSGVQDQETTSAVVGTSGYVAPEYAMNGVLSTKSDVYSFGILLLEIISGQLNSSFCATHQGCCLVEHAWSLWCEEKGTEFIDPVLKDAATSTSDQMLWCLHIGLLCIEEDVATRPTMSMVVLMLGNNDLDLPSPTQPPFIEENVAESSLPRYAVISPLASKSTR